MSDSVQTEYGMETSGSARSASETARPADAAGSWERRDTTAAVLTAIAFLFPVAVAIVFTIVAAALLPTPDGWQQTLAWWSVLIGGSVAVVLAFERLARRFLPMATLLRLSLVFPDEAPSRFRMALRSNSARQLRRRLDAGVLDPEDTPHEAATNLLELTAALSAHDRMTRGHAERVRAYSTMIGEEMGLSEYELSLLQWSALMHDVGKLEVSAAILNKPGRPTDDEWGELTEHPGHGGRLVEPLRPWLGEWVDAASQHHERFDGTGYPAGLAGEQISLSARIVSVADAFDVMTATRSYKRPMSSDKARNELAACIGTQFAPNVVRAFLTIPIRQLDGPMRSAVRFAALAPLLRLFEPRAFGIGAATVAASAIGLVATFTGPGVPDALAFSDAVDAVVVLQEDEPATVVLDTNIEATSWTVDEVVGPLSATIDDLGALALIPDADAFGPASVAVTACRDLECVSAAIAVDIAPINDPPTAVADEATFTGVSRDVTIDVLANDSDAEDDALTIQSVDIVDSTGRTSRNGNAIVFTPDRSSVGPWTIFYTVADQHGYVADATVTITNTNAAPVAVDDVVEAVAGRVTVIEPLANDTDDHPGLVLVDAQSDFGPVQTTPEGTINYRAPTSLGEHRLRYTVSDAAGVEATGTILVVIVSPVPQANDDDATAFEGVPISIDVIANDGSEGEDFAGIAVDVVEPPSLGEAAVSNGQIRYTPPAIDGPNATTTLVYSLCTEFGECSLATVHITIESVNAAPSFVPGRDLSMFADSGPQVVAWATNITAGEGEGGQTVAFAVSVDRADLFASAPTISPDGSLRFTPAPGTAGLATVTVTLRDNGGTANGGIDSMTRTFSIRIV